jgi:hypothetical protein
MTGVVAEGLALGGPNGPGLATFLKRPNKKLNDGEIRKGICP